MASPNYHPDGIKFALWMSNSITIQANVAVMVTSARRALTATVTPGAGHTFGGMSDTKKTSGTSATEVIEVRRKGVYEFVGSGAAPVLGGTVYAAGTDGRTATATATNNVAIGKFLGYLIPWDNTSNWMIDIEGFC